MATATRKGMKRKAIVETMDVQDLSNRLETEGFIELGNCPLLLHQTLTEVVNQVLEQNNKKKSTKLSFDGRWMLHLPLKKVWMLMMTHAPSGWIDIIRNYFDDQAILVAIVLLAVPQNSQVQRIHRDHYFLHGKELILPLSLEEDVVLNTLILPKSHKQPDVKRSLRNSELEMKTLLPQMHVVKSNVALMDTYCKHASNVNTSGRDLTKRVFFVFRHA